MNWSIGRSYPMIGAQSFLQKKFVQAMQNVLVFLCLCIKYKYGKQLSFPIE